MARVSLIICDYCKEARELLGGTLTLSIDEGHEKPTNSSWEICHECAYNLEKTLKAPNVIQKPRSYFLLEDAMARATQCGELPEHPKGDLCDTAPSSPRPRGKKTDALLEGELVNVKSTFNKEEANRKVESTRSKCPHHFKSYEDGKIICGNSPIDAQGPFAGTKGCGKTLGEHEI